MQVLVMISALVDSKMDVPLVCLKRVYLVSNTNTCCQLFGYLTSDARLIRDLYACGGMPLHEGFKL